MPIHVASTYFSGLLALETLPTAIACVAAIIFLKQWSSGVDLIARLDREEKKIEDLATASTTTTQARTRTLHGTVIIVVGGFTSQGLLVCSQLSSLGAQLILLTPSVRSSRVVQLIHLLRDGTSNPLIYAEECDVTNVRSVEAFAAQWNLGDGAERLMSGPATELAGGVGSLDNIGLTSTRSTTVSDHSASAMAAAGVGGKAGVAPRRVDSIVLLPTDESRYCVQSPTRFTEERVEVSQAEVLGRFHLVNLLLPSLLLLPPNRDIRVISLLSPWYAAGVHANDVKTSPWVKDGRQSLLWLSLSRELQRRIQLMTEADQRPRTKLPGIDHEGNATGHARPANVNVINVCAGFERGRDVLDYLLPSTGKIDEHAEWDALESEKVTVASPSSENDQLKAMIDPRLKNRKGSQKNKTNVVESQASRRVREKLHPPPPSQSLFVTVLDIIRYAFVAALWPFAWLLCKSPTRAAETVTWATIAPICASSSFDPALNATAVVPGELHREGRVVRPPLPASLLPGKATDVLWTQMEEEAKEALSKS